LPESQRGRECEEVQIKDDFEKDMSEKNISNFSKKFLMKQSISEPPISLGGKN